MTNDMGRYCSQLMRINLSEEYTIMNYLNMNYNQIDGKIFQGQF